MKIGIITMHRVLNSGSALQAYALQQKISELGGEVELIDYQYKNDKSTWLKRLIKKILFAKRDKEFVYFYRTYFKCSPLQYTKETIKNTPLNYDIYCTGSDQVWNPRFIQDDTNFMLSFIPDDKPRFSFAASFTTSEIPQEYISLYKKYLAKYDFISVREKSGIKIIKQLLNKEAYLVCDPTLLLDSTQWNEIINQEPFEKKEKYILVYKLGYMFDSKNEIYKITDQVYNKFGYKVYYLNGKHDIFRRGKKILNCGPLNFINYIKNAEFIITDSFHGTAFSAIYNKPFVSVVREKNNCSDSRIVTMLQEIGGEKSIITHAEELDFSNDYKINLEELDKYRKKSMEILAFILKKITRIK